MSYIIIKISNGKNKTYNLKDSLLKEQFKFTKKPYGKSYWEKKIDNNLKGDEYSKTIEFYFKEKGLRVLTLYPEDRRSNDYRKAFLEGNKGIHRHYFCAYCGTILNENSLTVDHIIPIDRTSKSRFLKWILRKFNIEDINDIKNLTPSCRRCNSRKGSKVGLSWIVRGLMGRYVFTWILVWLFLLGVLMYLLINFI